MKVGIMTFHTALNYGAVLQAYALNKTLIDKGVEAEIIDYSAPFNEKRFAPKKLSYFLNIRNLYSVLFCNSYQRHNKRIFDDFKNNCLRLSKPIYNQKELGDVVNNYDVFIVGSDQVWNLACTERDDSYFLPFVNANRKKNSYAASIGYAHFPESERAHYKALIEAFNKISVRETSAVKAIKEITGRNVSLVLDPTLLLTKEKWRALFSNVDCRKYKFLLLYLMSEDRVLIKFAKKLAKEKNLKIIYITQRFFKLPGVINQRDVSIPQWLSLFHEAEIVVTNSFHGLAFSINFDKDFFTRYIPRSIANSRLQTLLDMFDLHYRRIDSDSFNKEKCINTEKNQEKLEILREKSINFLNEIMNDE